MSIHFVGAGPGDPELLTIKAQKILQRAGCCVWAGSLVNPSLLTLLPKHAEVYDSASMNLEQIVEKMVSAHTSGKCVARLHTGDPALYGAIGEQMDILRSRQIPFEIIPGVSAFQGAAASMQIELTRPDVVQSVVLTRTPGRTSMPENETLEHFAKTRATLCIYLSVSRIDNLAGRLITHYGEDCPAAVVFKATWPEEKIVRGTLSTIGKQSLRAGITKTALILVGRAIESNGTLSKLYNRKFSHEYREGKD